MKISKTLSQLSMCAALALSAQFVSAQALTKVERPAGVVKQMAERNGILAQQLHATNKDMFTRQACLTVRQILILIL